MSLIEINSKIYLDKLSQQYKKILVVNLLPKDNLFKSLIKTITIPRPSYFEPIKSTKCNYAILNPNSKNELLELNDIGILFNYLTENGFNLHNTFNDTNKHNPNFICYVSK